MLTLPAPRRNAVVITAWMLFWALMIMVAVQDFVRNEHSHALWKPVLWEGSSALVTSLLAYIQVTRSRGDDRLLGTPWRWFARQALWLPMYWIAFVPLAFGLRHGVYALMGQTYAHDPLPRLFFYESMKISIFVGLFTAIRFGIGSWRALLGQKLAAERAHANLVEAQLLRLGQQMQPHFLFNALNTVSALMYTDVARADATLAQLAEMLRATLDLGDLHAAPLATELRLARNYAGIMGERFADRVAITWDVDDALLGHPVPVLSLQPLLENVFKHTVERRRGMTRIDVVARRDGDVLVLGVADDAGTLAPRADGGGGVGLSNLRVRLAALYGGAASLTLSNRPEGGVRAELHLPYQGAACVS